MDNRDWTVEVYKVDRRFKEGRVRVETVDYADKSRDFVSAMNPPVPGYEIEIYETWVARKSALDGTPFRERYDVPFTASPRSESYWSN
jgi:hypothetical protein